LVELQLLDAFFNGLLTRTRRMGLTRLLDGERQGEVITTAGMRAVNRTG